MKDVAEFSYKIIIWGAENDMPRITREVLEQIGTMSNGSGFFENVLHKSFGKCAISIKC